MPTAVEKIKLENTTGLNIYSRQSFGCLAWVAAATEITFENGRTFTVGIAGGYNAMGLFGHEGNGVFVGNDDRGDVVVTGMGYVPGAQFVPTAEQVRLYRALCTMDWAQFKAWVNNCPVRPPFTGKRYDI